MQKQSKYSGGCEGDSSATVKEHLLCTHEVQRSDPSIYVNKSWVWFGTSQNLRVGDKRIDGASWLLSYWKNPSSLFSERLSLRGTRKRMMEEVS